MSLISDIHRYWNREPNIQAAFGSDSLYMTNQPPEKDKPYAVLITGQSKPVLEDSGTGYVEGLPFTIEITADEFPLIDTLAEIVMTAFDRRKWHPSVIVCRREGYQLPRSESGIFTAILNYSAQYQRTFRED